ncbi:MAG: SpoIID/LytB domain-containing protein, partial [Paludibacteraceae bacterium]|nr:SpoIID/LytB domain-containing protein [Paludibacteraceae bacterium]
MNQLPKNISVGIMSSEKISFCLKGKYQFLDKNYEGDFLVSFENQGLLYDGKVYDEIILIPLDYEKSCFELDGVIIGVDFHWQKKERQTFKGTLRLIVENNLVTAVNILDVEDYLKSVISSEMSATSYTELLKAHAVISRSWLLCQFYSNAKYEEVETFTFEEKDVLFVNRWYERDKHT